MPRIYRNEARPYVDVPQLDLCSFMFDSEHCIATDETVLHVDAEDPSNQLTKADLRDLVQRIAYGLRHRYGIGKDGPNKDVVTVMSYGQLLVPAAYYAIVAAGGIYSAASPSSTVSDLVRQTTIGGSDLLICSVEHRDIAVAAAKQCKIPLNRVLILESRGGRQKWSLRSVEANINAISDQKLSWQRMTDPEQLKNSIITILWSSGTTGLPKGVQLSHLNLVAETHIVAYAPRAWAQQEIERIGLENFPVPPSYRTIGHLPISHIAGLFGYLIMAAYSAGTVYWMRKYNFADLLKNAKKYEITAFYTVPSVYLRISKSPEVTDQFAHVYAASTGAAPMDGKLQTASNARLGSKAADKTYIGQTWGLSETTGAVTAPQTGLNPDDTGSISPILPNVELRMVDEDYNDVEPGQEGELLVRSVLVMNGYWKNPQATKEAFWLDPNSEEDRKKGHWFCTGDIGIFKNGMFYIVDRKKELLKYKGLQIAPAELENIIFAHPAVVEAAVVGLPAPNDPGTDWPRAYVVLADNYKGKVKEEEFIELVKHKVSQHKQLRGGVVFVDEIPKNAIGKFLRRELRERAKKEVAQSRAKL